YHGRCRPGAPCCARSNVPDRAMAASNSANSDCRAMPRSTPKQPVLRVDGFRALAALLLAAGIHCVAAAAADPADETAWRTQLSLRGGVARAWKTANGSELAAGGADRRIDLQPAQAHPASPMFDALFALAQVELDQSHIVAIKVPAYNEGKPIPCKCLVTG